MPRQAFSAHEARSRENSLMLKFLAVAAALLLGGCTSSTRDRMLLGGAIGGTAGAVAGAVATGTVPGAGALNAEKHLYEENPGDK